MIITKRCRGVLLVAALIIGFGLYLVYLGATTTWQYYLLVDECCVGGEQWVGKRLRVSGKIAEGTLHISNDRREASFVMAGTEHRLAVRCDGPLPDNLVEGREVVVEGHLQSPELFDGQRVTTRCASKYAPKQATDNMY